MKIWSRILFFFPIWLVFCTFFYGIVFVLYPELFHASKSEFELLLQTNKCILFLTQVAILLGTISSIYVVSRHINNISLTYLRCMFDIKGIFIGVLLGILVTLLTLILLSIFIPVQIKYQGLQFNTLFYAIIFFIVAVSEETLSRGYIFYNLFTSINKLNSILISSAIFALMHAFNASLNFIGFINILLAGILFTLLFLTKMNLSIPIGIHFSWNFFIGPIFGFSVSGFATDSLLKIQNANGSDFDFQGFGLEGSFFLTLIIIPFILYFSYKNKEKIFLKSKMTNALA